MYISLNVVVLICEMNVKQSFQAYVIIYISGFDILKALLIWESSFFTISCPKPSTAYINQPKLKIE